MIGSIINSITRFTWGFLLDKVNFRLLWCIVMVISLASNVGVLLLVKYEYVYAVAVCLGYATQSFVPPALALASAKIFGPTMGSQVFGFVCLGYFFGYLVGFAIQYTVLYFTGYFFTWITLMVITISTMISVQFHVLERKKMPISEDDKSVMSN
jgi:MFS family permease